MEIIGQFLLFVGPPFVLSIIVGVAFQVTMARYTRIPSRKGLTGAQVAQNLVEKYGLKGVKVEALKGTTNDHYAANSRVIRLSQTVYHGKSLAAAGIAAHEMGHAHQHATRYPLMFLYAYLYGPMALGSRVGPITFVIGLALAYLTQSQFGIYVAWAGAIIFGISFLISLILLPVEFNASSRARQVLLKQGLISPQEMRAVSWLLNMAALTYVAAAVQSFALLAFFIFVLATQSSKRKQPAANKKA